MNPFLKTIVTRILGTAIRHGVTVLGAWLAAKGAGELDANTQANITQEIIGGICVLIGFAWSYYRTHQNSKIVDELKKSLGVFSTLQNLESQVKIDPKPPTILPLIGLILFSSALMSCALISKFDQNSLDAEKKLKYESLSLMANATQSSDGFTAQIKALQADLSTEIAYEMGKGKKNLATQQELKILSDPHKLLGRFLQDWQTKKTLSQAYIDEESKLVGDAWDQLITLESSKEK